MSLITAAQWVPRGYAAPFPKKYTLDDTEYQRIASLARLQLDEAEQDLREAGDGNTAKEGEDEDENDDSNECVVDENVDAMEIEAKKKERKSNEIESCEDDLKEYDLENYDESDGEGRIHGQGQTMSMFGNARSLAYYESNDEDPYITLKDEDEDEDEDVQIMATDNLILAAKVEDEIAHLEVYVFEDDGDNLYVHHDIMLPAIPLCLEWLDMPVGQSFPDKEARGNFVAIGSMEPDIEIWDLDTMECMYPNAILGPGGETSAHGDKAKKRKKKGKKVNEEYHVDAVLSLAANRQHRNLLASASADKTIKLWDINTAKCAKSYSYHTDKVCSLAWHRAEATVLLSGSYDRTVVVADMRAPGAQAPRWEVESDVENVQWDPHDANVLYASTEQGAVHCLDLRTAPHKGYSTQTKALWTLQAHDETVSSFDLNNVIRGFMATGSTDRTVKLWNVTAKGPSMVVSRNLDVGKVFATTFAPDAEVAFRLAVAGSSGSMHVWDTSTNAGVRRIFGQRVPEAKEGAGEDWLIGVAEDDDDYSSLSGGKEDRPETTWTKTEHGLGLSQLASLKGGGFDEQGRTDVCAIRQGMSRQQDKRTGRAAAAD